MGWYGNSVGSSRRKGENSRTLPIFKTRQVVATTALARELLSLDNNNLWAPYLTRGMSTLIKQRRRRKNKIKPFIVYVESFAAKYVFNYNYDFVNKKTG